MELTEMQQFFLSAINASEYDELNPGYLSVLWCEHKGKRRGVDSRDSFGHTTAAYKTCRKLTALGLIKQNQHQFHQTFSRLSE